MFDRACQVIFEDIFLRGKKASQLGGKEAAELAWQSLLLLAHQMPKPLRHPPARLEMPSLECGLPHKNLLHWQLWAAHRASPNSRQWQCS